MIDADTNSLTDVQLQYLPLRYLDIQAGDLPAGLPQPREPRWPFSGGLTDYMRAFGPGMFVGRGMKRPLNAPIQSPGTGFLVGMPAGGEVGRPLVALGFMGLGPGGDARRAMTELAELERGRPILGGGAMC